MVGQQIVQSRLITLRLDMLGQVADAQTRRGNATAAEIVVHPGQGIEQRRLAGAIRPDQTNAVAWLDGQADRFEYHRTGVIAVQVAAFQKRHTLLLAGKPPNTLAAGATSPPAAPSRRQWLCRAADATPAKK